MSSTLQTLHETLRQAQALRAEGEPGKAVALCQAVLELDPARPQAWHLLGVLRLEAGESEAACAAFEKAIGLAPDEAVFYVNLASAQTACGQPTRAADTLGHALSLDNAIPEAHYNLGNTLLELGRMDEAERCFVQAIALNEAYGEAHNNLGHVSRRRGDPGTAITHFQKAVAANPHYGPGWSNLCSALLEAGRTVEAIDAGRRAVLVDPRSVEPHYNLGNAFAAVPIPGEAAACYRRALQIDPEYVDAFVNLGVAMQQMGECDAAVVAFDHALARAPTMPQANWNKALALLASGKLLEGWELYEWRWQAVDGMTLPAFAQPQWDGAPLDGRRILIQAEQGYGDTIQFLRYLPMVRGLGGQVLLECPPALERLLSPLADRVRIIVRGEPRPDFDLWLPIMSLPRVFGTRLDTVPADCPYLTSVRAIPDVLGNREGFRVGLVWRGSLTNNRGQFRSCRLADLQPLLSVPGVEFFSLQTELAGADRTALAALPVTDLGTGFADFADTAAAVQGLDLVITIDTAVGHLAGALGRPVWTLLSAIPDWRWLRDRDDSPWYPTMRLFRQNRIGEWAPVMAEVADALAQCAQEPGSRQRTTNAALGSTGP